MAVAFKFGLQQDQHWPRDSIQPMITHWIRKKAQRSMQEKENGKQYVPNLYR